MNAKRTQKSLKNSRYSLHIKITKIDQRLIKFQCSNKTDQKGLILESTKIKEDEFKNV